MRKSSICLCYGYNCYRNIFILQLYRLLDRQFGSMFFLSLTIIRFKSMRNTYFRCISSQLTDFLQLGRIGHARILFFQSAPIIIVSAIKTESKMI